MKDLRDILDFLRTEGYSHLTWDGKEPTVYISMYIPGPSVQDAKLIGEGGSKLHFVSDPFGPSCFTSKSSSAEVMNRLTQLFNSLPSFTLLIGDVQWELLESGALEHIYMQRHQQSSKET